MADFRFARAVENRRGEGNTFAEAFGVLQQLIVTEFRERLPHRGLRKHLPEPAAQRFGLHFLAEQPLEAVAQLLGGPSQMRLQNLADIHTRRNAQRIENDLDGGAVRHVRHVLLRHDARDDTLVAVAAGHLVADGELALHGDIGLDQLDDLGGQLDALGQQALVGLLVVQVGLENLAAQKIREALEALIREDADFIGEVLFQFENLRGFDGLVALVLLSALASEDLDVHDGALDARWAVERRVANIAGLFAKDGAEQFFFRCQRGLALRRDFADEDVSRLHHRTAADDAAFVEVAEERLADVGNIACDFLGTELGVARFDFVLLDVNGSVVIVFDQLFADQNGVFEVVSAPGYEGHQHIAAKGQLTALRAGTVGQYLAFLHAVAHANQRLLADASVLVRTLEFDELIDVRAHFAAQHAGVIGFHAHDDALGIDLIDDAFAFAEHNRAGIARRDALHPGADERGFTLDE